MQRAHPKSSAYIIILNGSASYTRPMLNAGRCAGFARGNSRSSRLGLGGQLWVGLSCLLLSVACGGTPTDASTDSAASGGAGGGGSGGAGSAANPQAFKVHEWGTFTSMVSSAGQRLPGMQHEDEALPDFVLGRAPALDFGKAMEAMPGAVTQKMETPVLYFYSDQDLRVDIDVTFTDGIISQWFPEATSFWPAIGEAQAFAGGNMRWQVDVSPEETQAPPAVAPDDIWAPSRRVASQPIRVGDDVEQFVFYRGLGDFDVPLEFDVSAESISVKNRSAERVPSAFYLHLHPGGGYIQSLGAIEPGQSVVAQGGPKELDLNQYLATAKREVRESLVASGLFEDEAQAMVDTWASSYFLTPGQRVLYVLPRGWTDALLPIQIAPTPDELVRTLVGRVEILSLDRETSLMQALREAHANGGNFDWRTLGHFAEPQLQRAMQLEADARFQSWVGDLILDVNVNSAL